MAKDSRHTAHPVRRAVAKSSKKVTTAAGSQLWSMSDDDVADMDLAALLGGLSPAVLDDGEVISAATARRLACEAGIVPAVLGTSSELLDLARTTRLFTGAQRRGMNLTQPTCTAEGCDWPAHLCHAHHDRPRSSGGTTDLANARNLCPRHHARIHDPTYDTTHLPNGDVAFHRRT